MYIYTWESWSSADDWKIHLWAYLKSIDIRKLQQSTVSKLYSFDLKVFLLGPPS